LAGSLIGIKFVSESVYEIRIPFESQDASLITYSNNSYSNTAVATGVLRDIPLGNGFCPFELETTNK
jgi:hypothetical protein